MMTTAKQHAARITALLLAMILVAGSNIFTISAAAANQPLSYWTDGSASKTELVSFMNQITDKNSASYIPVEDRIAVFDLDGTLFCETDPVYMDHLLLVYRVYGDPSYVDKATDYEKAVADKVLEFAQTGTYPKGLDVENGKLTAAESMYSTCAAYGWVPISMKNDWTTIYGDGVTRLNQ